MLHENSTVSLKAPWETGYYKHEKIKHIGILYSVRGMS